MTDSEVRVSGVRALVDALGTVGAERFISLLSREPFDYTAWQRDLWAGRTMEEISDAAMAMRRGSEATKAMDEPK